jgi:hypothetical protein
MRSSGVAALLFAGLLATNLAGQIREDYLDVFIARVKPEKRGAFDNLSRKMADANRKNKGDNWLCYEVFYGEHNAVYFVSARSGYGAIESGMQAFEGALAKALGPAGAGKLFEDFGQTVISTRAEVRRRRLDLSANAPADAAAAARSIGETRFLRTFIIRVRPGRAAEYEAQLRANKEAQERGNPGVPILVSQSAAGQQGSVYYITIPAKSMADFDKMKPLPEVLGAQGYARYLKVVSEVVLNTESFIARFLPALSNPPADVVAADPAYWTPKPPPPAPAKKTEAAKQ